MNLSKQALSFPLPHKDAHELRLGVVFENYWNGQKAVNSAVVISKGLCKKLQAKPILSG